MLAVVILVILDTVSGVLHALAKKEKFKYEYVIQTALKGVVYSIGIAMALVASNTDVLFLAPLDDIVLSAIIITEIISISAHLAAIHTGWSKVWKIVGILARKTNVESLEQLQRTVENADIKHTKKQEPTIHIEAPDELDG